MICLVGKLPVLKVGRHQLDPFLVGGQEEVGENRHRGLALHDPLNEGELPLEIIPFRREFHEWGYLSFFL